MVNRKHFLVLDTETHGVEKKLVYDIAWTVTDKSGDIVKTRNYLVREIITNPDIMRGVIDNQSGRILEPGAYYHAKIYTQYLEMLDINFSPMIRDFAAIVEILREDIKTYGIDVISAYNFPFDSGAIRDTAKFLEFDGKVLESRVNFLDLYLFACQWLFTQKNYKRIADRMEWKSPAGNYRTTAEHAYRYISGDWNFSESHTALNDAIIETDILADLMRRKKTIPYNQIVRHPWRLAQ